jgi:hypothetical protein
LNLAVLNFEMDASALAPYVPERTELDRWQEQVLVSLVGFQFRDTRVWNVNVPFHRDFSEVNLRFYVRRRLPEGWRRGVVFVKELAPHRAIAWMARLLYGENYVTVPVRPTIDVPANGDGRMRRFGYAWQLAGRDYRIEAEGTGPGYHAGPGSEAEFILDQSWGYSGRPGRPTIEYRVEHPPWTIWSTRAARFDGDVAALYGTSFVEALSAPPRSAYLADGSGVSLYRGARLR